ncbi:hypothetical protein AAC387_Pa06g1379 [Persea americana]
MEVNDLPPGYRFNPSDNLLIDDILEPMTEGKPTQYRKAVKNVENFYSFCPFELDGAKDILESKENSLYLFVRRNRMSTNGKKVSRAAKDGSWRARDKSEEITTKTGTKAKRRIYMYTLKHKSEECGVKWIMEEYVLDRGENFEDYALCKLRVARSGKRKQGEEPSTSGKRKKRAKKDADNAAEERDNSRHGEGPKTNPPLPIENCSQETSDTGSLLLPRYAAELERDIWSVLMENGIYADGWFYRE